MQNVQLQRALDVNVDSSSMHVRSYETKVLHDALRQVIVWSGVNWLQVGLSLPAVGGSPPPSCSLAPSIAPASLSLDPLSPSVDSASPAPKAPKATRRAGKKNRKQNQN
eukprot:8616524-Karenia_brevis.AAC.1